jgi:hypothetical protein
MRPIANIKMKPHGLRHADAIHMNTLEGICPIPNTPFRDDGTLDLESELRLVDHLLKHR